MAILKLCSYRGCSVILENTDVKYCQYHQAKYDKAQKERYKDYQRRRLEDLNEVKSQDFYNSREWDIFKDLVKASLFHIDIFELYLTGRIIEGETVHHIIEIKEDWDKRLDKDNMIYLTQRNHMRIHKKYSKSQKDKIKTQKILLDLIKLFNKEFK